MKLFNPPPPRGCQPAPPPPAEQQAESKRSTHDPQAHGREQHPRSQPGGHSPMAPPGPIPNPEVKHRHVDGSRTTGPARVDSCQDQTTPVGAIRRGLTVIRGGPCILLPSRWLPRSRLTAPRPFGANGWRHLASRPYRLLRSRPLRGAVGRLDSEPPHGASPLWGKCCAFV